MCHWIGRSARRDCHDAHARTDTAASSFPASSRRLPSRITQRPGERTRLPPRYFALDDIDETLERLRKRGAQLVGEVVQYKRRVSSLLHPGPEGLLIRLAQELR